MENFIKIATDFSKTPGARYRSDGKFSGEEFFETILKPKFKSAIDEKKKLTIDLDGTHGFATSFLNEAFNSLAIKFGKDTVLKNIIFLSSEEPYLVDEIKEYVEETEAAH